MYSPFSIKLMHFFGIATGMNKFVEIAGGNIGGMGRLTGGDGGLLPAWWNGEEEDLRLPSELSCPDVDDLRESDDQDYDRDW